MEDHDFVIPVSVFQNKDDNQPQSHAMAWHAFAQRLGRYDLRVQKDGLAWSPVTYVPGTTRGKANVDAVHALVLDIDHSDLPLDLLEGREYVAHTTFQHTPEAPRWRVVLLLEHSVSGADWPGFWLRANAYFGGCVDPATKDSSRIFYLPSCPPGAQHEVKQQHGRLLDPAELPEVPVYEPSPRRRDNPALLNRYLVEWAHSFAAARANELGSMPRDSGRNDACNRAAYLLGGLIAEPAHDLKPEDVVDLLLEACARNGLIEDDGQRGVEATIRSGLEAGLVRAWSPADQDQRPSNVRPFTGRVQSNNPSGEQLKVEKLSQIKPEKIDWAWDYRLARGKATLMIGDPGLGKTLLSNVMAAIVSVGGTWPDGGSCDKGAAILFTIEDGLADTVVPRMLAAGADMDRVFAVQGVVDLDKSLDERLFALEEHISLLEELIRREDALLVVMDPITAYLGPNVNAHKDTDVRRVLAPLQMMAERTGVALLLLMHLTKGSGVSALYRATGSIAFPAVCRIVLGVAPDPNDPDGKRRLLLPIKMNIAPEAVGIGYRIETTQQQILPRADAKDQPPVIVWDDEPVLVDATTALDRTGTVQEMGALAECKAVLAQIMQANSWRVLAREGERQLKEAGVSSAPTTVMRARRELGIEASKEGIFGGAWSWVWPELKRKVFTRARVNESTESRGSLDPLESPSVPEAFKDAFKDPVKNANDSPKNPNDPADSSRTHTREGSDMRYCPRCTRNLEEQAYLEHLPCIPVELCPVHHTRFDLHDCDQL